MHNVIAIDGPAASGKGTLARQLAEHLGFHHLDTGLTYRAVAYALLQQNVELDDEARALEVVSQLDFSNLDRETLSAHDVGEAASKIAVMGELREALVALQREFSEKSPGAVLDGRDIGTIVCPDAPVKLYVTASAEVRARRRSTETTEKGGDGEYEQILEDIIRRDQRDMSRSDSPLKPAEDAHLIDTSEMSIETAFQTALALVKQSLPG